MENIKVNPEELRIKAANIRKKIDDMRSNLKKATDAVQNTENSYVASAAQEMRAKYDNELEPKFVAFYNKMSNFADHLDEVANSYEKVVEEASNEAKSSLIS